MQEPLTLEQKVGSWLGLLVVSVMMGLAPLWIFAFACYLAWMVLHVLWGGLLVVGNGLSATVTATQEWRAQRSWQREVEGWQPEPTPPEPTLKEKIEAAKAECVREIAVVENLAGLLEPNEVDGAKRHAKRKFKWRIRECIGEFGGQ